ncbi:MAG: hypothetical protein IJJ99_08140 [Oscillospiraceae bacterium]|nr:hypothetical protein [Clostridia bacterium]MBQ6431828.1 hypothetical protein [Oscillospiraceae bacterium]
MQDTTSGPEWLTVKQFAVASGCTTQAVYKRLNTTLQPYTKQENGRTLILSAALNATKTAEVDNSEKVVNPPPNGCNPVELAAMEAMRAQIDRQAAELDRIRTELERTKTELTGARLDRERFSGEAKEATARADAAEQRTQAAEARADAADRRAQAAEDREREAASRSADQITRLTELLNASQQSALEMSKALATSQALQAGQIQLAMQDGDRAADQATVTDAEHGSRQGSQTAGADAEPEEPPKRRGLFARIFKR